MNIFDSTPPRFPLSCAADYRRLAEKRLPKVLFDYIDGGALDEATMRRNKEGFNKIILRKRVFRDVSAIDTSTTVLGQKLHQPVILAPVAFAGLYARRGEVQAARAAEKSGVPFTLANMAICSIEEVRQSISVPFWFQFFLLKDRDYSQELLKRAEAAGCPVLLLSADLPSIGSRRRYHRSRSRNSCPFFTSPRWALDVYFRGRPLALGNAPERKGETLAEVRQWMGSQLDSRMTWKDLEWVRSNWRGKIAIKGILDPEDAREAAERGVDGIIVSNHGGRHIDSVPSTISVLPEIVKAAGSRLEVIIDSGISGGLDVAKALALGARACMIGRAWAFALAARGEAGVSEVLSIFHSELKIAMSQLGVSSIQQIDKSIITPSATG